MQAAPCISHGVGSGSGIHYCIHYCLHNKIHPLDFFLLSSYLVFLRWGSPYVAHAGLKLLGSSNPRPSASWLPHLKTPAATTKPANDYRKKKIQQSSIAKFTPHQKCASEFSAALAQVVPKVLRKLKAENVNRNTGVLDREVWRDRGVPLAQCALWLLNSRGGPLLLEGYKSYWHRTLMPLSLKEEVSFARQRQSKEQKKLSELFTQKYQTAHWFL